jgi:hypothetical protein
MFEEHHLALGQNIKHHEVIQALHLVCVLLCVGAVLWFVLWHCMLALYFMRHHYPFVFV